MRIRPFVTSALAVAGMLVVMLCPHVHAQGQQLNSVQRGMVEDMLSRVHDTLKRNYYDPSFHGVDIDARYSAYAERLKSAQSLPAAFRIIAAYLSGLDDSHTVFLPPQSGSRVEYGYRMQLVGNDCFITDVRPGTDAAKKLHPGDQVLSLDGYIVNPKDFWQLEYFLNAIALKTTSEFTVRDRDGQTRHETVQSDVKERQNFRYSSLANGHGDTDTWRARLETENRANLRKSRTVEQGNVLFWSLPSFLDTQGDIDHAFALAGKHDALVLDLRGNSGGTEDHLKSMLGSVFNHEVTVGNKVTRSGDKPLTAKSRGRDAFTGRLIVLVDSRSASAAEIFARVVQLEHRGTIVGDRTAGHVMESVLFPLREGAEAALFYGAAISSADLVMTDGKSLEKVGVTPDLLVLPKAADLAGGLDPALTQAAALAGVKLDPIQAGKLFPFEWPSNQ